LKGLEVSLGTKCAASLKRSRGRQFGISQADVRKVLTLGKSKWPILTTLIFASGPFWEESV
jgi:hypothetical protein